MVAAARHDAILRELELRGTLNVAQFAKRFDVAPMTVRRDLAELERRELLVRVHGGAISQAVADEQTAERHGRAKRRRPTATIGMIVPTATYYYPQVIRGASEAARELNCRLVLAVSNYSEREELHQAERLFAGGVDGLLITPRLKLVDGSPLQALLAEAPVPIIVVERDIDERAAGGMDWVRTDHAHGGELAVRHLAGLGHRKIALAARNAPTAVGLTDGYLRTMDQLGLGDEKWHAVLPDLQEEHIRSGLESFLDEAMARGVTAAIILGDQDAMATADIARSRGVGIPDQLALVAYDDEFSALALVPLTAVAPPKHDLGHTALRLCFDRIRQQPGASHAVTRMSLLPTVVARESTSPTPQ